MTRMEKVNAAQAVLAALADDLAGCAENQGSSVPADARKVLLSAMALVKTFGPAMSVKMDSAEVTS